MLNKSKGNMYPWVTHTWNPIRGRCPHNCQYCVDGNTLILTSDLMWKKIRDIKIGDEIISVSLKPRLHVTVSKVTGKIKVRKQRCRITFENGISIVCSTDHKFLTNDHHRWIEARNLRLNSKLYSLMLKPPELFIENEKYKKGWLAGVIDGDGTLKHYKYNVWQFRLAMIDKEAIDRAENYLKFFGIETHRFIMKNGTHKSLYAIRTSKQDNYHKIKELIKFRDDMDFSRGYLGGIFDAEGCTLKHNKTKIIRIYNKNDEIINKIIRSCNKLGFKTSIIREYDKIRGVGILGGWKEIIRFISITNPAIKRKRPNLQFSRLKSVIKPIKIELLSEGELYDIETTSGNFIANGIVVHNCYMKSVKWDIGELRLEEKCLNDNLGIGNIIFVGSSTDMWADEVPDEWILKVLQHCLKYPHNTYLFQSKNPKRFLDFLSYYEDFIPHKVIWGTTIETNRDIQNITKAPSTFQRYSMMARIKGRRTMVSIEPIMDFDLDIMVEWIYAIQPKFVSIGADSKRNNLPEPPAWKVEKLIKELEEFTEVKIKKNLSRILEENKNG